MRGIPRVFGPRIAIELWVDSEGIGCAVDGIGDASARQGGVANRDYGVAYRAA
jgi:hypothetical protein